MSIKAMKQALEALEMSRELEDRGLVDFQKYGLTKDKDILVKLDLAITSLRQEIEQAEKQQPFGYLWPTGRHPEFRFTQQLRDGVEGTPVYTTPQPQREWVGLSEQERVQIAIDAGCMSADWVDFAEAIEKALKEKNT